MGVQWERNISCGFGALRKSINVRNTDGDERNEIWMEIELLHFWLCFDGNEEGDFVASLCKFVGDVEKRRQMSHSKPWIHNNMQSLVTHISSTY